MTTDLGHLTGAVDSDGIRIHHDVHGSTGPAIVCLPPWMIVPSDVWSAQVGALGRSHRVVTYDARGAGRSDRPADPEAYAIEHHLGDLVRVLDATGTDRAVLVGNSFGAILGYVAAAVIPERVAGLVLTGSSVDLDGDTPAPLDTALCTFEQDLGVDRGWGRFNRHSWHRDFDGFVRWFVSTALPEPHAGALRALAVEWGLDHDPDVLAATVAARAGAGTADAARRLRELADAVTCPIHLIHGARDRIAPLRWAERVAERHDAPLTVLAEIGHCPHATAPELVDEVIVALAERS